MNSGNHGQFGQNGWDFCFGFMADEHCPILLGKNWTSSPKHIQPNGQLSSVQNPCDITIYWLVVEDPYNGL